MLHAMNDLNRPTEERLEWVYLPSLQSFVLQTAHQWASYSLYRNKYPDKSVHEHTIHLPQQKVQPTANMTKAALILQLSLNHPINTWMVSRSWEHCPWRQRVMFPSIPSHNMTRTPERTGPTVDFQLWFCKTSQPKGNQLCVIMVEPFFRKEARLPPSSQTDNHKTR